jgi:LysR family transcriptional regulator, low CO2-responsive transcriptional regulator
MGSDRMVLVVGKGHRWENRNQVTPAELPGEHFVTREQGSGTGKAVFNALSAAGLDPGELRVKAVLGGNEGVKQAIASGTGIAFVSELSIRRETESGTLVPLRVEGLEITRRFYIVTRTGRDLSPAAAAFAEAMRDAYGDEAKKTEEKAG